MPYTGVIRYLSWDSVPVFSSIAAISNWSTGSAGKRSMPTSGGFAALNPPKSCLPVGISVTVRASVPRIIIRVIRPDILSLLGPEMNLHGLNDRIYIGEIS